MFEEKRSLDRHLVLKRGTIVMPGGNCNLPCVVLDLSSGGAKLRTDQWLLVPDRFTVNMDGGLNFSATVCYRDADMAGVQFVAAAA